MSEEMNERGCDEYADDLGELALGVLTGRDRARALSHVEACPRCAEELEQLSRAADAVVQVAPEVEPPVGFETRVFERMGVANVRPRRRRPVRRYWVPASVAAAVVALAVGLGVALTSSAPPVSNNAQGGVHHALLAGDLWEGGQVVGHVETFGGAQPRMQMTLHDSTARGRVRCLVVTDDGVMHWVGTFEASEGYGTWAAPLHVNPEDVRSAEVVSASGAVIATATLA
jgi:hypothetical protein